MKITGACNVIKIVTLYRIDVVCLANITNIMQTINRWLIVKMQMLIWIVYSLMRIKYVQYVKMDMFYWNLLTKLGNV